MMQLARPHLDIGLVVSDLDASLGFYRDLLGLPVRGDLEVPEVGRLLLLDLGASTLKLVAPLRPPTGASPAGGLRAGVTGMRYLTLNVHALDDLAEACRQAGHRVAMRPTPVGPGMRAAAVEDPDRNWIEFLEVTS
ncbi:VOC family protein [Nocardioides daejeonensis]|uniref:VOC family protein n=1 Tax=Nocardioides daejeonensis TaxID=1046556 RepID=UPI000D7434DE|nr:VOC family protein [Nocardioides daejeonensis]